MNPQLLLSLICDEGIITSITIPVGSSIEQIINTRDSDDFSQRWMAAYKAVESRKGQASKNLSELSAQIREAAYLRAYARWKSPDLAAYVSDDFGLIADALALGKEDPWINAMCDSYKNGTIPGSSSSN
jgi:hypothetical protein